MPFSTGTTAGRCRAQRRQDWACGRTTDSSVLSSLPGVRTGILPGEYRLKMTECAELCRVALDKHRTPVTRILAIAIRMLKREMPGLRLLVSYADLNQGHLGKIYQASNWIYVGTTGHEAGIMLNGKLTHRRTINSKYGTSDIDWLRQRIDSSANRLRGKAEVQVSAAAGRGDRRAHQAVIKNLPANAPQAETRCARPPVWRGRGSTDRGAPVNPSPYRRRFQ